MALIGQSIAEFDFFPDAPPAIVGEGDLVTGQTVNMELWESGVVVSLTGASGCTEINSTGRYTWSTSGISTLTASRQQYHWRMSDGTNSDEGDFVLVAHESRDGGMPSLNNKSSYIVQN
ncbi:hypothetical protein LCGC14_0141100 [marine sediment metagenome]|uniref:Uncharacterized protein n=1 Tax=marine sediment metagenome TaxID=412755 RepID=A0A0F9V4G4_9ZZZZ